MKKLVAALGAVFVPLALLVGPAGGADVPTATSGVALEGEPAVGTTLQVVPAEWASTPDRRTYEWLRDGEGDVLSRETTYTPSDADLGHTLVVVERVWFGTRQDETSSVPVAATDALPAPADAGALATPATSVTGSATVGGTLQATVSGTTAGAATALQWQRDGADIAGATGSAYGVTKADAGRTLTVRATSSMAGRAPVSAASAGVAVRALNTKRPTIKGTAAKGKRLSVKSKGAWVAPGQRFSYQWLRNGKKISGATKTSYRLTSKDRKKKISVRVSVSRTGFATVSATSKTSSKVR